MKRNKSKQKKNGGASSNNNVNGGVVMGPPSFKVNVRMQRFCLRYDVAAAGAFSINYVALVRLLGVASSAASATVLLLFESVRLRQVRLYAAATIGASLGSNAVGLEFSPVANVPSGTVIPGIDTTRTNTATTSTAGSTFILKKPPAGSSAAGWLNPNSVSASSSIPLLAGTAPIGSVLDLVLDVVVTDGSNPFVFLTTTGAATSGMFAYQPHANLVPQDYPPFT